MLNAQIKAEGLLNSADKIDWKSIMEAMQRDGYQGEISLATEVFDNTFDRANDATREILHIAGRLS